MIEAFLCTHGALVRYIVDIEGCTKILGYPRHCIEISRVCAGCVLFLRAPTCFLWLDREMCDVSASVRMGGFVLTTPVICCPEHAQERERRWSDEIQVAVEASPKNDSLWGV